LRHRRACSTCSADDAFHKDQSQGYLPSIAPSTKHARNAVAGSADLPSNPGRKPHPEGEGKIMKKKTGFSLELGHGKIVH
jgi:hypothetical protein